MPVEFTAHNIRLDDGSVTRPGSGATMDAQPVFVSARRLLETVFPGDRGGVRIADLGCLEGGYSVEFARLGFQVLGLDVREANIAACRYVKERTRLPNLEFVHDDAWNIARYGRFDAIFCCGLLYHLDRPREFLRLLSGITGRLLILQTHFAEAAVPLAERLPRPLRRLIPRALRGPKSSARRFRLSPIVENESLKGRWFTEFASDAAHRARGSAKWASWDNRRSFWVQREFLLQAVQDAGFDLVMEQFDGLGPDIAASMTTGYYRTDSRGTFIGIKTR